MLVCLTNHFLTFSCYFSVSNSQEFCGLFMIFLYFFEKFTSHSHQMFVKVHSIENILCFHFNKTIIFTFKSQNILKKFSYFRISIAFIFKNVLLKNSRTTHALILQMLPEEHFQTRFAQPQTTTINNIHNNHNNHKQPQTTTTNKLNEIPRLQIDDP